MSELYRLVGPNIRKEFDGLRPAQLEALEAAFAEVDGGSGMAPPKKQAPKETIVTNIDPHNGKKAGGAKKKAPHQISKYDEEEEDSETAMRGNNGGPEAKMQHSPVKGAPPIANNKKGSQPQAQQQSEEQTCGFCGKVD